MLYALLEYVIVVPRADCEAEAFFSLVLMSIIFTLQAYMDSLEGNWVNKWNFNVVHVCTTVIYGWLVDHQLYSILVQEYVHFLIYILSPYCV